MNSTLTVSQAVVPLKDSYKITGQTSIGSALTSQGKEKDALFVFDTDGVYLGVLSFSNLMFNAHYPYLTKASHAVTKTTYLTSNSTLFEAAREMVAQRIFTLPVFDELQHPTGMITEESILHVLGNFPEIVAQICTRIDFRTPVTVSIQSTVGEVYKHMREQNLIHVILVDAEGKLCGMTSRNEIKDAFSQPVPRERFTSKDGQPADFMFDEEEIYRIDAPIRNFYTQPVLTMAHTSDCTVVVPKLISSNQPAIVLIDEQRKPTKYLSVRDVLNGYVSLQERENIPVKMAKPRKHMDDLEINQLQDLVSAYLNKLNLRAPVMEAEVTFKEAKSSAQHIKNVHSKVIVTLKNGMQLVGIGEDRKEGVSIRQALKRIDAQERKTSSS